MSQLEVVTTGYLDDCMLKTINGGKVKVTSQIHRRCHYGQTQQKSCTTLTLTLRNVEAVTHHFIHTNPLMRLSPRRESPGTGMGQHLKSARQGITKVEGMPA